jgi:hypothetical protein
MRTAYPTEPKSQFDFLVEQADRYLNRPKHPTDRTTRQWKRRAVSWLREYAPTSGLQDSPLSVR